MNNQGQNRSSDSDRDQKKHSTNSINETLRMLDEAAGSSTNEIKRMSKESLEYLAQAKDKVMQSSKDAAMKVDQSARENPWYFVGATAAIVGIAGFILGRKSKSIT